MMITLKEILKNTSFDSVPKEHQDNLMELLEKINKVRSAYGKPMIVTSGYRSMQDHLRIYREKGITDKKRIPMASKHLSGQAIDISDPKGELDAWCVKNEALMAEIGIWLEHPDATKGWTHFQIAPPKSGKRFFYP